MAVKPSTFIPNFEPPDSHFVLIKAPPTDFYILDNMKMMDDLAVLKPTIFCSVPRLYNRIYAGITNTLKISGTLRQRLFTAAYNSKKEAMMNGQSSSLMWDRLVFNKMKEKLGGQVCFMASASPLSLDVMDFLKGEYVVPEKIENVYAKCKFVGQCFTYGDSMKSCLVAVIAVDPNSLKGWAASQGIKFENLQQLCNDPRARTAVLNEMNKVGKESQLRGFEFAKAVTLVPEPFSMDNGLLTPTFKIKRPQATEYFARAISNMYVELSTPDPTLQKTSRM